MADNKGVLVVGDINEGKVAAITAEMLGAGKKLATKLGEPLEAALVVDGAGDADGLMRRRIASINDAPILETERAYYWPLGRRPNDHPGLSDLGF